MSELCLGVGQSAGAAAVQMHTCLKALFGNTERVTNVGTEVPVAVEYRLSSTCHVFCFRKTKRCIREAPVRICTPQSTSHMASQTGPSGTTFQVKSTLSLSFISKLMRVQLKEFSFINHKLCVGQSRLWEFGFLL